LVRRGWCQPGPAVVRAGLRWSGLGRGGPRWSGLVRAGPGWSALARAGPRWPGLVRAGPGWSALARAGPRWSAVARGGPRWSAVARAGPRWPALARAGPRWSALARRGRLRRAAIGAGGRGFGGVRGAGRATLVVGIRAGRPVPGGSASRRPDGSACGGGRTAAPSWPGLSRRPGTRGARGARRTSQAVLLSHSSVANAPANPTVCRKPRWLQCRRHQRGGNDGRGRKRCTAADALRRSR
jgi:hypothetical protein